MIALYGFLQGDCMGLVIVGSPLETVKMLAEKLLQAAGVRVASFSPYQVIYQGKTVPLEMQLGDVPFHSLERFDVRKVFLGEGGGNEEEIAKVAEED